MRVTNGMIHGRLLKSLQEAKERLVRSQTRVATQKNISKPSEDPIGLSRIMSYHRDLHKLRQAIRNAENTSSMLSHADTVLQQATDLLIDVRRLAVAMSSDTVDEDARQSAAYEVELAMDQMLQKANTKFGGRYIFSGHKILTQPYQEIAGVIDYVGDLGEIEQRVGVDGFIKVNIPGSDIFGSSGAGVFKVLLDLKNALDANDGATIQASMALIDEEIERISAALGTVGTRMNLVESNLEQLRGIELSLDGKLSQIEDVDMAVEAAEYMANQEAYQAALEAASSALELPNLLDYLQ